MGNSITEVFARQQAHAITLRSSTSTIRIKLLKQLKSSIQKNESSIYKALQTDLNKSNFEAALTEVLFIYSEIDFAIKNLHKWMKPTRVGLNFISPFSKNRIYYEPKGTCLIIAPWNYPFQLVMSPLVSAIAAGNTVFVKPSELSSATSKVIHNLIEETFAPEQVYCVEGDAEISTQLLELPFDHVFFTGSTQIGKIVMQAAAQHLTSVTLELGGKSPTIVDKNTNLQKAADKIAWGKHINAGQTCIAPDYVLIHKSIEDQFVKAYIQSIEKLFFENGELNADVYGKIINQKNFDRLTNLLEELTPNKNITYGGQSNADRLIIHPTVVQNITEKTKLMQEEIFGPILPILNYTDINEVLTFLNCQDKPLAMYIFSDSKQFINTLIKNTAAGGTCVNDVLIHISNPKLPFGGVKTSGVGSCHGAFGFKAFSHERGVVFQSKINFNRLIYPPYKGKNWVLNILKKMM